MEHRHGHEPDLSTGRPPSPWPVQAGVDGVASPDIVRSPSGTFVVTYDSNPDVPSAAGPQSKLYYRTSSDLVTLVRPPTVGAQASTPPPATA